MTAVPPTVFLVDDDPGVLRALTRMMTAHGWNVAAFESAEAFLAATPPEVSGCLVLDVNLPGLDGLSLQAALSARAGALPIIFLTGAGDIPMSVRAMKAGASDFLTKPVSAEALVAAVRAALATAASSLSSLAAEAELQARFARLTPREREVLMAIAAGRLNKQIAGDLGIVEQTVKFHRARLMERMEARTVAELMHIAARLGIGADSGPKPSDP